MSYEGARSITGPFLASDGFDLDEFVLLVHVVEDPKAAIRTSHSADSLGRSRFRFRVSRAG